MNKLFVLKHFDDALQMFIFYGLSRIDNHDVTVSVGIWMYKRVQVIWRCLYLESY